MRSNYLTFPKLRFPEFGEPWIEKKLGESTEIVLGQSPKSQFYNTNKDGLPLIQGANDFTKIHKYTTQITKVCEKNDIIMSIRAPVGTLIKAKERCCLGRGVCAIKANDFFYHLLTKDRNRLKKYAQGSTFDAIGSKDLQSFKIFIPPTLAEQEKIASFLSAVDKKIDLQEQKIEQLEKYKKALLQKLFATKEKKEPELRFPEFSGAWVEKRLGEIGIFQKGTSITKKELKQGNIPVIAGGIDPAYFHNQANRQGDTITISSSGVNAGFINYFNIPIFASDSFTIQCKKNICITRFLFYLLKRIQNKIFLLQSGGAQPHIYPKDLMPLKIHIPPTLAEQEKIASFLSRIDEKIKLEKEKLDKIKSYKKGLLQKMFV